MQGGKNYKSHYKNKIINSHLTIYFKMKSIKLRTKFTAIFLKLHFNQLKADLHLFPKSYTPELYSFM